MWLNHFPGVDGELTFLLGPYMRRIPRRTAPWISHTRNQRYGKTITTTLSALHSVHVDRQYSLAPFESPWLKNWSTVSNDNQILLHVVQNNALRGILPVYRTTPIPALYREAAIRPIQITLDHKPSLAAARMKRLDSRHPLVRRTARPRAHNFDTRLLRTAARACPTESHDPLVLPPLGTQG
jgi:hypothetical protein